jgi:hypothetical protein
MKRLFEVNGQFFDKKQDAKEARGERRNKDEQAAPLYMYVIHKGPDHWKLEKFG